MWNLPNPMISTASSTVNVFCPEHQRERKIDTHTHRKTPPKPPACQAVKMYLLFVKGQCFSCYCETTPGKRLKTSPSCVFTDQPLGTLVAGHIRSLLKQQLGGRVWSWGKDSFVLSYLSCFRNPRLGLQLGSGLLPSPAQTAVRLSPSAPLGYRPAPSTGAVNCGLPLQDEHCQGLRAQFKSPKPFLLTFPLPHFRTKVSQDQSWDGFINRPGRKLSVCVHF